jgi:putative ABC transport system ATP-binding protein
MRALNERYGVTFLISTHDPRVMAFARRKITLKDGRIVEDTVEDAEP